VEFLRACQREGLLRLERDRQGVLRVFPGPQLVRPAAEAQAAPPTSAPEALEDAAATSEPSDPDAPPADLVDTTALALSGTAVIVDGEVAAIAEPEKDAPAKGVRKRTRSGVRTAKKTVTPRTRKKRT
jgi:hypothetical protein